VKEIEDLEELEGIDEMLDFYILKSSILIIQQEEDMDK
jgi:hypothetical protein